MTSNLADMAKALTAALSLHVLAFCAPDGVALLSEGFLICVGAFLVNAEHAFHTLYLGDLR